MYCTKCGKQVNEGAVFCVNCGKKVWTEAQAAEPSEPPLPNNPPMYSQGYEPPQYSPYPDMPQKKPKAAYAIISICAALFLIVAGVVITLAVRYFSQEDDQPVDRGQGSQTQDTQEAAHDADEQFDIFMDELFAEWVSADTLTMQFFLADPEVMGIERPKPTYGEVTTQESIAQARGETERIKNRLAGFQYSELNREQQVIYDILSREVELSEIIEENDDFIYYMGYVRPFTGMQVELPILLAEFKFYTASDIERYLELLSDTIRYFDDIIAFERERAARGFFLSDANLDTVIEQLESFLEHREDSFLITVVGEKIDQYPGLTDEQRERYKSENTQLVLGNVLVAYDNLLEAMRSLKGVGPAPGGLASLPDGRRFAEAQLALGVGADRSAAEIEALMNSWADMAIYNASMHIFSNDELYDKYLNDELGVIGDGTPQEYLSILEEAIKADFPAIDATNYVILEVHESLSEHISPAFFLTPAVDCFDDNVIYINPAKIKESDNIRLFTVLAHEGYPGHLYESVYDRRQSRHPIRAALGNMGYSEGWATYVEHLSYGYAGLPSDEAAALRELNFYNLLIQAQADIGVNLLNWGVGDVASLLEDIGIYDDELAQDIYDDVTGMPLNTSMYALGYIEFLELLSAFEEMKGDSFALYDFHKFILDFGPAPFPLIFDNMG